MEYKDGFSNQVYTDGGIASLKYIGKLIDSFLVTEKDFWLLDYIINAVFSDSDYDAYARQVSFDTIGEQPAQPLVKFVEYAAHKRSRPGS